MIDLSSLIPFLAILLPLVMPYLGDALASILAQDGFPSQLNNVIAWLFLILAAVATAFASNQLTGNANQLIGVVAGSIQLLLSGPLTSLKPWVNLTALLQSKAFNVVPATPGAVVLPVVQPTPMPVQPPVAQPAQLSIIQPEVPFSAAMQQSQAPQFRVPTPVAEHPPIEPSMMVNTLPTLPVVTSQPTQQ